MFFYVLFFVRLTVNVNTVTSTFSADTVVKRYGHYSLTLHQYYSHKYESVIKLLTLSYLCE